MSFPSILTDISQTFQVVLLQIAVRSPSGILERLPAILLEGFPPQMSGEIPVQFHDTFQQNCSRASEEDSQ